MSDDHMEQSEALGRLAAADGELALGGPAGTRGQRCL